MQALNGRLLIDAPELQKDIEESGQTVESSIVSNRHITSGYVKLVSPEAMMHGIREGDTVYFPRYAANEFQPEGSDMFFSVHVNDIEFKEDGKDE